MRTLRRLLRYGAVSAVSTTLSLTVLGTLVATRALTPGWANVVATSAGIVPSFELNRRWVWRRSGRSSLMAEIGPFCALTFAGLVLSTLSVSLVATWATGAALAPALRTIAIELANVAAFGTVWIAQFVILDRIVFARPRGSEPAFPPPPSLGSHDRRVLAPPSDRPSSEFAAFADIDLGNLPGFPFRVEP